MFLSTIPSRRRSTEQFIVGIPGKFFIFDFLKHQKCIGLQRRAEIEKDRHNEMSPSVLAAHFARFQKLYKEYDVKRPEQVFNLEASGVSTRTTARRKAEDLMNLKKDNMLLNWTSRPMLMM